MNQTLSNETNVFSQLYAVVLNHQWGGGSRVRWSPKHQGWVGNKAYARYHYEPWMSEPRGEAYEPDVPCQEELRSALELSAQFLTSQDRSFFCHNCNRKEAKNHFIAPDVYGEPTLYCLQVPDCSVVDSFGGTGQVKHWGSPYGCQSVKSEISHRIANAPYIGPVAAFVYGRPLPADEVINREWCSRCTGFAQNVGPLNSPDEERLERIRERIGHDVRRLSREMLEHYGT